MTHKNIIVIMFIIKHSENKHNNNSKLCSRISLTGFDFSRDDPQILQWLSNSWNEL